MVDHALIECPRCGGAKGSDAAFVKRVTGCSLEWLPCPACQGSGAITVARRAVFDRGERIRERRLALDLSLREFATTAGLTPMHLSGVENGRGMPEMFEACEAALTAREREG